MKQTFLFLLLPLVCLGIASCSNSTEPGDTSTAGMSFKINGTTWTSDAISESGTAPEAFVVGSKTAATTEIMTIHIDSAATGRTLQFESDDLSFFGSSASLTRSDGTWQSRDGSGVLTITDVSGGRLKGNFTVTLYKDGNANADSLKITDGAFNSLF